jgi:type IV pilus assembly protein PilA
MRKGFTLIELLLVVVIIGIVAALVLPKFGDVKSKAYVAAMKSDLRNLATAEEIYADKNATYGSTSDVAFTTSDNVSIVTTINGADGFTAVASHSKLAAAKTCTLDYGTGKANKVSCN